MRGSSPRLLALNKLDLMEDERRRELSFRFPTRSRFWCDGRGARRAARRDRGALPGDAAADGAARALRARAARCPSCTTWPASWSARTRRGRARARAGPGGGGAALRALRDVNGGRRSGRCVSAASRRRRARPRAPMTATPGSTCTPPRRHARSRRAGERWYGHRGGDPRGPRRAGHPALRSGGPPRHLARERARPDRCRLPRRAARPAAQHGPDERSRSSPGTGSRSWCSSRSRPRSWRRSPSWTRPRAAWVDSARLGADRPDTDGGRLGEGATPTALRLRGRPRDRGTPAGETPFRS